MRITFDFEAGESLLTLQQFRRRCESAYLKCVVERIGHRGLAAKVLGISRKNLWEHLRAHGLSDLITDTSTIDALRHITDDINVAA